MTEFIIPVRGEAIIFPVILKISVGILKGPDDLLLCRVDIRFRISIVDVGLINIDTGLEHFR